MQQVENKNHRLTIAVFGENEAVEQFRSKMIAGEGQSPYLVGKISENEVWCYFVKSDEVNAFLKGRMAERSPMEWVHFAFWLKASGEAISAHEQTFFNQLNQFGVPFEVVWFGEMAQSAGGNNVPMFAFDVNTVSQQELNLVNFLIPRLENLGDLLKNPICAYVSRYLASSFELSRQEFMQRLDKVDLSPFALGKYLLEDRDFDEVMGEVFDLNLNQYVNHLNKVENFARSLPNEIMQWAEIGEEIYQIEMLCEQRIAELNGKLEQEFKQIERELDQGDFMTKLIGVGKAARILLDLKNYMQDMVDNALNPIIQELKMKASAYQHNWENQRLLSSPTSVPLLGN